MSLDPLVKQHPMCLVELLTLPKDVDEMYWVNLHGVGGLNLFQLEKNLMIEVLLDYSKYSFE